MRRVLLIFSLIISLGIILSSCGGGEKAEDTGDKPAVKSMLAEETPAGPDAEKGKVIYDTKCMACHLTGVTGAPMFKENERWVEIANKGMDTLVSQAINGFQGEQGLMPPRGGFPDLTDDDIKNGIAYMLQEAGVEAK
ncbi:MAG: c-type cytochrome [Bacteroidota bacterium]